MNPDDLTEIEHAGRRCAICRSGRHWKQFQVVRADGREPTVMCSACHVRYGDAPPAPLAVAVTAAPAVEEPPKARKRPAKPTEDRLRKALRELPRGAHSTGRIAKAAGLNHGKTLGRLHQLEAAGEIHQVGKLWSTEPPATDLEGAFDRLEARTSNLRIIRDRSPVG
jgi:hypothetical protein